MNRFSVVFGMRYFSSSSVYDLVGTSIKSGSRSRLDRVCGMMPGLVCVHLYMKRCTTILAKMRNPISSYLSLLTRQ